MATLNATSLLNAISDTLLEEIDRQVVSSMPALDNFYPSLVTTSMGVYPAVGRGTGSAARPGDAGTGFQAIHVFKHGVSGAIEWVSGTGGPDPMNNLRQTVYEATGQAYPG